MSTKEKPGRIGGVRWEIARPGVIGIYSAAYSPSGRPLEHGAKPWTVIGPKVFETFHTHAEAIDYAFKQVGE